MQVIPVLDVMNGQVVRGVAGRREEYRPVVSQLVPSSEPLQVAQAFHEQLGLADLYVADLDAIAGAAPNVALFAALKQLGFRLLVDAGVSEADRAQAVFDSGVDGVVVGLETLAGPDVLAAIVHRLGPHAVVFSLDLKEGVPLGELSAWQEPQAWPIAREALGCGVRRLLVLDLARVGVSEGLGTAALCRRLRETDSGLELLAGGGVRGLGDLVELKRIGVDGVLVASALHDRRIGPSEIERLRES